MVKVQHGIKCICGAMLDNCLCHKPEMKQFKMTKSWWVFLGVWVCDPGDGYVRNGYLFETNLN